MTPNKTPPLAMTGFFDVLKYTIKLLCFFRPNQKALLKPNTLVALTVLTFFILFAERLYLIGYPLGMPKETEFYLAIGFIGFISYRAYHGYSQAIDTGVVLLLFSYSLMYTFNQQVLGGAALMYIACWQCFTVTSCVINSLWDEDKVEENRNIP